MTESDTGGRTTDRLGVGDGLSELALETNVLVAGPTHCGKEAVALELLAGAYDAGGWPFAITTTETAAQFRTRFEPFVPPGEDPADAIVVDAHRVPDLSNRHDSRTHCVDSPEDLTGIGIELWNGCESIASEERTGGRLLIDNFSTLAIYSELEQLFEFIATCNRHATELGLQTIMLVSTDAVAAPTVDRLRSLFPTTVEVNGGGGRTRIRARGEHSTSWREYVSPTPV